jgi:diguanylate cyclase (GGDEF)-like protein
MHAQPRAAKVRARMSAATSHRRLLLAGSVVSYGTVFVAFLLWERPGLGIGHFYYVAIALLALAAGPWFGAVGGFLATALFSLGILVNPHIPPAEIFTAATLIRLVTFAAIGALVGAFSRSNRVLVERLQVAAERDFLTNLLNARAFEAALERRLESRRPFALVLGDMDGLKRINDERGHAAGNEALRELADALIESARRGDLVARVGGDEFALLASVADEDDARGLVRRIEEELAVQQVRMSFGSAVYPADGASALTLFRIADARLYDRKLLRRRLAPPPELKVLPGAAHGNGPAVRARS